jgi:hypothetical protein
MIEALRIVWSFRRYFGYAALLLVIGWLWLGKNGLEKDLLTKTVQYNELAQKVEDQNQQVDDWKAAADENAKAAQKALESARVVEKHHTNTATRILMSEPRNSDQCIAALELLKEYQ